MRVLYLDRPVDGVPTKIRKPASLGHQNHRQRVSQCRALVNAEMQSACKDQAVVRPNAERQLQRFPGQNRSPCGVLKQSRNTTGPHA